MDTFVVSRLTKPAIVGSSKDIRQAVEVCRKAARENSPVLFQGEIGVGKLLLASYLHYESSRLGKPFLLVDCDSEEGIREFLSPENSESKLKFLKGGTLYFREIAGLTLSEQARLQRFCLLAEAEDVRVLLGSSQNVHLLMYEKAIDAELYHYATQREIYIAPLRQRRDDIMDLAGYFIKRLNQRLRKGVQGLTPQAEEVFLSYGWPGNVEELRQSLTRAMILTAESFIGRRHLAESIGQAGDFLHNPDVMPLDRMEELLLRSALSRYGTTLEGKKRAARALNISLATLYNKVKRYNVSK
ncbi:RNA polymerase sigma factor 54 interaction domain protein [Acididesulfobacillus acetoxydans]|uniref:RNA polymerase sigma factor 54 interaction domain protein n=1 Tax=Acididesulfobacillus acetoxydans TaxID=1561005 RepID=A0A8S0W7U7_9FIRM|nr:sigma 54-interacting transcriptional regulator [Acididesulfobacillus acetoxydans]CAA7601149.1 RNA polymerase sigma factor 54 interaction domain protein [Acididesulfobacillus acetoxydans]CEJ08572.1 Sigma-54 interaction domain protein [Acididesulfobacillus acetoxydans]